MFIKKITLNRCFDVHFHKKEMFHPLGCDNQWDFFTLQTS